MGAYRLGCGSAKVNKDCLDKGLRRNFHLIWAFDGNSSELGCGYVIKKINT